MKEQGGYAPSRSGSVKCRGTKDTKVKKPLQKNFSKDGYGLPSDCSRALTPKQKGQPE